MLNKSQLRALRRVKLSQLNAIDNTLAGIDKHIEPRRFEYLRDARERVWEAYADISALLFAIAHPESLPLKSPHYAN